MRNSLNKKNAISKYAKSEYEFRLSVCLFVSNKRQNDWTGLAQICSDTLHGPREGQSWKIVPGKKCRIY